MSYKVSLSRQAEKAVYKLPKYVIMRIVQQIDELEYNQRPSGCRKLHDFENKYRIRVGDYRILYSINDKDKNVIVHRIIHRREAYR